MKNITIENKAVATLKQQIDKLANIGSLENWNNWHQSTLVFVVSIYGEKTTKHYQFYNISPWPTTISSNTIPNIRKAINQAQSLLESFIIDIEEFGFSQQNEKATKNETTTINIANNNNLTQSQNIELNIIFETIQDELPPKTMREIEEVTKSKEPQENKLKKIGEILKKSGENVIASALAKLIGHGMGWY